jgi:transmembrane sensor
MTAGSPLNDGVLTEAAGWRLRLHELGVSTTQEFESWRASSPKHEAAWNSVEAPWRYMGDQATAPELIAVRGAALERARREGRARWQDRHVGRLGRLGLIGTAAAACLLVAVAGAFYIHQLPVAYRTGTSERRVVTLEDGSTVSLDSRSEIAVRYAQHARELTLVRGQGRFDVAHDVERPFSVVAGDQKVVATGTSFEVDLIDSRVMVTLIEGHVVVLDRQEPDHEHTGSAAPREGVKLEPGERLVALKNARLSVQHVNLERATAWQSGYLIFEDETLASAVERVNRYARNPVVIRDPSAAALRFSGVFKEGDTAAFVDSVARYLPIDGQVHDDGSIELKHRE